jgi:hypothetical protein
LHPQQYQREAMIVLVKLIDVVEVDIKMMEAGVRFKLREQVLQWC